jgi:hypothetical protein
MQDCRNTSAARLLKKMNLGSGQIMKKSLPSHCDESTRNLVLEGAEYTCSPQARQLCTSLTPD